MCKRYSIYLHIKSFYDRSLFRRPNAQTNRNENGVIRIGFGTERKRREKENWKCSFAYWLYRYICGNQVLQLKNVTVNRWALELQQLRHDPKIVSFSPEIVMSSSVRITCAEFWRQPSAVYLHIRAAHYPHPDALITDFRTIHKGEIEIEFMTGSLCSLLTVLITQIRFFYWIKQELIRFWALPFAWTLNELDSMHSTPLNSTSSIRAGISNSIYSTFMHIPFDTIRCSGLLSGYIIDARCELKGCKRPLSPRKSSLKITRTGDVINSDFHGRGDGRVYHRVHICARHE